MNFHFAYLTTPSPGPKKRRDRTDPVWNYSGFHRSSFTTIWSPVAGQMGQSRQHTPFLKGKINFSCKSSFYAFTMGQVTEKVTRSSSPPMVII